MTGVRTRFPGYSSPRYSTRPVISRRRRTCGAGLRTENERLDETCVCLSPTPAGHIGSVIGLLRMYLAGVDTIIMDSWNPAEGSRLVERFGVTHMGGAVIFLTSILEGADQTGADLSSLVSFVAGAASVPPAVIERADARGIPATRCYGSSEHPTSTSCQSDDPLDLRAPGLEPEAQLAVLTGDLAQGAVPSQALESVRLLMLVSDWVLRPAQQEELANGWPALHSRPALQFAPVALTPDELPGAWYLGRAALQLQIMRNGRKQAVVDAKAGMQ